MTKNWHQVKQILNKCQGTWAWVGQRGVDAYGVLDFLPVEAAFCCDFGAGYSDFWSNEALFSVEKEIKRRENWGNQDLEKLWQEPVRQRIEKYIGRLKAPINTVCYRSLAALETDRRFRVLAPSLALKDRFDDKLRQLALFSEMGIETPPTRVCRLSETSFAQASAELDGPFVVQPPVGSSGENTYFVNHANDFDDVRAVLGIDRPLKLSKYLPVPSLNGHGIVLKTAQGLEAIAVCPSVQIVGAHGCTTRAEIYCGNDFAAADRVAASIREEICTIMEKVGLFMGRQGFLGIFGMDFLLSGNEVLALEINPRFQGSTMLLSLLQYDRGEVPLALLHVMQFMDLISDLPRQTLEQLKRSYRAPYSGAHLIVHSLADQPFRIEHDLKAGIYALKNSTITRLRSGTTYRDLEKPDEWCIIDNLPLQKTKIFPEARLAMIQTNYSLLDNNLYQLGSQATAFVDALQSRCRRIPF